MFTIKPSILSAFTAQLTAHRWGCGNGVQPHVPNGGCEADAGSYRIPVAQALEEANITVTTVGSVAAAPETAPPCVFLHRSCAVLFFDFVYRYDSYEGPVTI